jgi:group I intron endonuclease
LYIGSSVNLIKRFEKHIKGIKSNINLQHAIKKYGLSCFYFIIFETYNIENNIKLVDLETTYISFFKFEFLYNFKLIGTSMLGYKHNNEAKRKIKS